MDLQEHLKFLVGAAEFGGECGGVYPLRRFPPGAVSKVQEFFLTVLFSMEFSLCVEVIQLVGKVGILDVDDVILNTLGGLFGYVLYWLFCIIWRKKNEAEKK